MEAAAQSGDRDDYEELLKFFIEEKNKECFAACLYTCYDLLRADVVFELVRMNGLIDFAMPYLIQFMRDAGKVDAPWRTRRIATTRKWRRRRRRWISR